MKSPREKWLVFICLLLLLLCLAAGAEREKKGRVISVIDGDSLVVQAGRKKIEIRLFGIDCPEHDQPYGGQARRFTERAASGKDVTFVSHEMDRYGRLVAEVVLPGGRSLNHELVKAGLAWWYREYAPDDRQLKALEQEARAAKRGLWRDPNPTPPWEWRRNRR
jgi:micrococcal nuclease